MKVPRRPRYPHVRVAGGPFERGTAYGRAARQRIHASLGAYSTRYQAVGCSWEDARRLGRCYRDTIHDLDPGLLAEMAGIARGAGVEEEDILALNVRTEIMALHGSGGAPRNADGCTAVAVMPQRASGGRALLAQNWDWLTHVRDTVIVLEVERSDAPSYVTVVEAGLVAKVSLTSAGLAVGTNFLLTDQDGRCGGVPYHLVLRALLDCADAREAVTLLRSLPRASSANFLLVDLHGTTVDVEAASGGAESMVEVAADDGVVVHANHFRVAQVPGDLSLAASPGSPRRHHRMQAVVDAAGATLTAQHLQGALADHEGHPLSICAHSRPDRPALEQEATAFGIVMEPATPRMWICDGSPCAAHWRELHLAWFSTRGTSSVHG